MRVVGCSAILTSRRISTFLPCSILEVLDKGKAAAVTSIVETKDKATGKVIFENQSTVFIRGAGGFGGKRSGKGTPQELRVCGSP